MSNDSKKINCPKCGYEISIDDALSQQIEQQYQEKMKEELSLEKTKLEKEIKLKASKYYAEESKQLKSEIEEKSKKIDEFRENELKLRKEKIEIEESKKNLELEVQRQLDSERKKMQEEMAKNMDEQNKWKVAEKDKVISDLKKQMDEMRRKVEQGSQQSQGEVVELELENILRQTFPYDEIVPVGKGINGADVIHIVKNNNGLKCGEIIWELKNTKSFTAGWIPKLKEDMRKQKSNIAVIVTNSLPENIKSFDHQDGVWITKFEFAIGLATALRSSLIEVGSAKLSAVNKNEKMEFLYSYLTGNEFKQRVEAIAEAFIIMQEDIAKERRVYEKIWSKREKLLGKVVTNTFGMYGDLEGLIGPTLPEIKQLSIDRLDDEEGNIEEKILPKEKENIVKDSLF